MLTGLATRRPFETAEDAAEGSIVFGSCCSDNAAQTVLLPNEIREPHGWKGRAGKVVVSGELGRGY